MIGRLDLWAVTWTERTEERGLTGDEASATSIYNRLYKDKKITKLRLIDTRTGRVIERNDNV